VSENISFRQLLTYIANGLNKKPPHINVNRVLATFARWQESIRCLFTGKKPLITKETVNVAFDSQYYSNEKATKALEHRFRSIEETIARVSDDFTHTYLASTP
jgi:nucleoside-diphosphate-sugar epimerase